MLRRYLAHPLSFSLVLAVALALLALFSGTGSTQATTGSITATTTGTSSLNTDFTLTIAQNTTGATAGSQATIAFDKTRLQIQSAVLGAGFNSACGLPPCLPTSANTIANANTTGSYNSVAGFVTPPNTLPGGTQDFLVLTLRAITCGKSTITLSGGEMIETQANGGGAFTPTLNNGQVTGVSTVDFNPHPSGDGIQDWATPIGDTDCDKFTTTAENYMVTDPNQRCASDTVKNNEGGADLWPYDFNDDQKADIFDVSSFSSHFNTSPPNPAYNVRWDLNAGSPTPKIDIFDVSLYSSVFNRFCA